MHSPAQAELQQTPSTQWSLKQSLLPPGQLAPFDFPVPHTPLLQVSPEMQSLLPPHVVRQVIVDVLHW
jgi:hypothetical protein